MLTSIITKESMCIRPPISILLLCQAFEVLLRLTILFVFLHVFYHLKFTPVGFAGIVELFPVDVEVYVDESFVYEELILGDLSLFVMRRIPRRVFQLDPLRGMPCLSFLLCPLPALPALILLLHGKVLLVICGRICCCLLLRLLVHE